MPRKASKTKRKSSASAKIGRMGSMIMAEAKRIRRASPGKKWTSCVSAAAKSLKK